MALYRKLFKRLFDIVFSLILFIILLPIFLIVSLILLIANNGNPFFLQVRPGLNGQLFKLIKFKTMNNKIDVNGHLLPDAERITLIGSFIRKSSLDEIPQLLNVLKGEMSLVGPRPLLIEYLPLYNDFQKKRHNVRPGITGWAQTNGRNAISWNQKFECDNWYADHVSFRLDMKILWTTLTIVFKSEGISQQGHITMERFRGNHL